VQVNDEVLTDWDQRNGAEQQISSCLLENDESDDDDELWDLLSARFINVSSPAHFK
jgi:hypothetical protein